MCCSDIYFLKLSAVVLLKVATKGVKYYYSSIISFILNSEKLHIFKVFSFHVFVFLTSRGEDIIEAI